MITDTWIQTYTGKRFSPLHPRPQDVCIEDIAHSLSLQCRFTGHTSRLYSVAQHSLLVSALVPPEDSLVGLLHDASEAYLSDIARPAKVFLPQYKDMEEGIQRAICERFGVPYPFPPSIHEADNIALATECRSFFPDSWEQWTLECTPRETIIEPLIPAVAEMRFLDRFSQIGGE